MLRVLGFVFLLGAIFAVPASAAAADEGASTAPADDGTARVVGVVTFEGTSPHAAALSRALSAQLRGRGHWVRGGRSLQQVQSELQCTDYESTCMAGAAKLFESELVIYGTLRVDADVHQLEMVLLDGSRGVVQSHVSAAIREHELSDANIENKAADLLSQLWPLPATPTEAEGPPPPPPVPVEASEVPPPGESKVRWGRERPVKRWKWAGLGTSASVAGIGAVLSIVGATRIRQPGGSLERELFAAADASLTDTYADVFGPDHPNADALNPENDIDRREGGDLCERAEASPPGGSPNLVTNADVATVCKDIRIWTATTTAGMALAVVGLVGVATFTTLLFVHRERSGTRARISPRPGGLAVRF